MNKRFFLLCILFGLSYKSYGQQLMDLFPEKGKTIKYFPADNARYYKGYNYKFIITWYSEMLWAMKEPVIYTDRSKNEIYRFTWLRTYNHPIAIRIENRGGLYFLFWKMCNGNGGFEPGKLIIDKQKSVDKRVWKQFSSFLDRINFWSMDTHVKDSGDDGAQWILEGKVGNRYHVVDRFTPSLSKDDFYKCCDFLIGLTDLKFKPGEKY